ncbi:MAG: CGNR zinc finger domain-containing protein [Rubrobacteraceae bacterium]
MDPNDMKPAPRRLRVVQEFVNTRSNLREVDVLEDVEGTTRWLIAHKLLPDGVETSGAERRRLVSFREGLRSLLATRGAAEESSTFGELDELAGDALLRVRFAPSGEPRLLPAEEKGVEGAMSIMLAAIAHSAVEGTWKRLKACRNEKCRWIFYDGSKNRSGSWCDMQTCGARHKMRVYRERKSG